MIDVRKLAEMAGFDELNASDDSRIARFAALALEEAAMECYANCDAERPEIAARFAAAIRALKPKE